MKHKEENPVIQKKEKENHVWFSSTEMETKKVVPSFAEFTDKAETLKATASGGGGLLHRKEIGEVGPLFPLPSLFSQKLSQKPIWALSVSPRISSNRNARLLRSPRRRARCWALIGWRQ